MTKWENYNKINISEKDLIPGFSIYLIEFRYKEKKFFTSKII